MCVTAEPRCSGGRSDAQTFADQAVIAIENTRLFNELQARTAELGRSVEELKALGEVGSAVSSTLRCGYCSENHRQPRESACGNAVPG